MIIYTIDKRDIKIERKDDLSIAICYYGHRARKLEEYYRIIDNEVIIKLVNRICNECKDKEYSKKIHDRYITDIFLKKYS